MTRIYLDEDVGGLERELSANGHDVLSVEADPSRRGRTDAWHFRAALNDRRVIVTWNRDDYQYLHRLWTTLHSLAVVDAPHGGVLTAAPSGAVTPREWLPRLVAKLRAAETMTGRLLQWLPAADDWREDRTRPEDA